MNARDHDRNTMEHPFAPAVPIPWGIVSDAMIDCPPRPVSSPPARITEDSVMKPDNDRTIPLSLRVARVPIPPDGPISVDCLECDTPVEIHQPDSELPERMLCTCEQCQSWYLLECDADADEALMILLPDPSLFRGLLDDQS